MIDKMKSMWPEWEVVDTLGSGTFGTVYEVHRNIFGHTDKAAIKVLSIPKSKSDIQELLYNGYDQKSITERFRSHLEDIVKEYSLMADLKGCANVVYCDDIRYVQHPDGIGWDIFIKMELLNPLITALINPVDDGQVVKIGLDICNALILCKEKNIIHRDIKPQNLFVSDDGTYKLGDFGIAKTAERTMGGTKTGTYNYMAPEVYNNQPYGSAADQYSLGMVLYWLLNERRMPFFPLPPEVPTASQEEMARQRRMSGEVPPMPKNGRESLKALVMRAIAPNPADRFESILDMKAALKAVEHLIIMFSNPYVADPSEAMEKYNMKLDLLEGYKEEVDEELDDVGINYYESIDDVNGINGDDTIDEYEGKSLEEAVEDLARQMLEDAYRDVADEPFDDMSDFGTIKDENEIPLADSTVGNSWYFDEGSVGPGADLGNMFNDYESEGTVGAKNSFDFKQDQDEEIRPKDEPDKSVVKVASFGGLEAKMIEKGKEAEFFKEFFGSGKEEKEKKSADVKKEEEEDLKGVVEFYALNDNLSPLAAASGSIYKFVLDDGKTPGVRVVSGRKKQKEQCSIFVGTHAVKVDIHSHSDPNCSRNPAWTSEPISFKVMPGYITQILANRPSLGKKVKLQVKYEKTQNPVWTQTAPKMDTPEPVSEGTIDKAIKDAETWMNLTSPLWIFNTYLKEVLELDPGHKRANELLDVLVAKDKKKELKKNKEFQLRRQLKENFRCGKAYKDLGEYYLDKNLSLAKWYYETGLPLYDFSKKEESEASLRLALTVYMRELAKHGDVAAIDKILSLVHLTPEVKENLRRVFVDRLTTDNRSRRGK